MSNASENEKLELLRTLMDQTFEDLKAEMRRLKLDRGKATDRRPLDLLEAAYLAVRYPAAAQGSAQLALLTLRDAIERSTERLLRRRPAEEEAANRRDRVLSIGRHCGRSGLAPAHFDALARDDQLLNHELSAGGRNAAVEWPDLAKHFLRGAQFLRALLASVDEALLRP
jgi:hypothetical protein